MKEWFLWFRNRGTKTQHPFKVDLGTEERRKKKGIIVILLDPIVIKGILVFSREI
jgi:hypothetical protein